MSFSRISSHFRREKVFGDGKPRPLDRNAKVRVMAQARALLKRAEKGRAYGAITAKAYAVLEALLWHFHNARSGLCFPSYEKIAEKAGCARSTVAEAIKQLEAAGLLSWVHRIVRIRERCEDLFGHMGSRWRVIRTSNGYQFKDPAPSKMPENIVKSSKSDFPPGTSIQELLSKPQTPKLTQNQENNPLMDAPLNFGRTLGALPQT